ncbi:MAG: hypothetical protein U0893_19045 [Chloroflexota bacterium]
MRSLVIGATIMLAVGMAAPAQATMLPSVPRTGGLQLALAAGGTVVDPTTVRASQKKNDSKKKKRESAKFLEIQNATRGKKDLEIKVKVAATDRSCDLTIEWNDGKTTKDDVEAGRDKVCELSVGVPSSRDALGDTVAKVSVRDSSGNKVATISKTFTVVK